MADELGTEPGGLVDQPGPVISIVIRLRAKLPVHGDLPGTVTLETIIDLLSRA